MENNKKNRKGVFGLTSVQAFFAIILGIALLAYVLIVIFGTLNTSTILPYTSTTQVNETGSLNSTGYTLSTITTAGFNSPAIVTIINATSKTVVTSGNYTLTNGVLYNASEAVWDSVNITYTYYYNTLSQNNLNYVLTNTSTGVTGFFSNINPSYTILAILVIILILVVLVRAVTGGVSGNREASPAL